jgi:hypothetical protein
MVMAHYAVNGVNKCSCGEYFASTNRADESPNGEENLERHIALLQRKGEVKE